MLSLTKRKNVTKITCKNSVVKRSSTTMQFQTKKFSQSKKMLPFKNKFENNTFQCKQQNFHQMKFNFTNKLQKTIKFNQPIQIRNFSLHEYQSQQLMKQYGINVPKGIAVSTPEEAYEAGQELGGHDLVVKAQILAGGRGLGTFSNGFKGGVKLVDTALDCKEIASKMLGQTLITKQTGPSGKVVNKVLITRRHFIRRETYFAFLLDRSVQGPLIVASSEGGMDIERVAKESPDKIYKSKVDINNGPSDEQIREIGLKIGFLKERIPDFSQQVKSLYKLFVEKDSVMVEINPLVETADNQIMCMDAKINFDTNAEFRQQELFVQQDLSSTDPKELIAKQLDLNYIPLDGDIGCLVNGAGLAMATMDIIKHHGGEPANFLDVGGGASQTQVSEAIKLISSDKNVKSILINIFGGIMRCDVIASGLVHAAKELNLKIPLIVRLQGTKMEEGEQILQQSHLKIISCNNLDDAAKQAVNVTKIMKLANEAHLGVNFELPL